MTTQYDVVVVGGGLAGLFASIEAAGAGARVALLDARSHLGGRARSDEIAGMLHNLGPHALFRKGATAAALRRHEVAFAGRTPSSPSTRFVLGDRLVRMPARGDRTATGRALVRAVRAADDPGLATVPLSAWLDDQRLDPGAAAFVAALVRIATYVDDPERFSAGAALAQVHLAATGGIAYLHGGWASLVDGLRDRAVAAGVEIRTSAAAAAVDRDGSGWSIGLADGDRVAAAAVVLAAGGPALAERLLEVEPGRWDADPVEASVLDVVLDANVRHRSLFAVDEPLYLATHCPPARLATGGKAVLVTAMRYQRPGAPVGSPADTRAALEGHLAAAAGRDVRPRHTRYLHRLTVAGSVPLAATGGLAGRPAVAVDDRPGVFLAGDWVGPTGLLADAASASGVAAGRAAAAVAVGRPTAAA